MEWSACILLINCESHNAHCYVFHLINYTVLLRLTDKTVTKCECEVIQLSSTMSDSVQSTVYSVSSKHYWTYLQCSHIRFVCRGWPPGRLAHQKL